MRNHPSLKLVTGPRGIGKSTQLMAFANRLLTSGVPSEKILFIDGESPLAYRLISSERTIAYISQRCPEADEVYVLIREGGAFPDIETTLGAMAANQRYNIFVSSSSRHMLTMGLGRYLQGRLAHYECFPPVLDKPSTNIRHIWHEAMLYDVHIPIRQSFNMQILNSIACHLSDSIGDALSLRKISAAVSPKNCPLSPHTIDNYLTALCDAYLIVKCMRYDLAEECILKNQFRCYFAYPTMREELFGAAPSNELRRSRLNAAWLQLRREADDVFTAASAPESVDFVTRIGENYRLWHVGEYGIQEVSRGSFVAG